MLSVGDFGHINNIFLMKTTLFNAGESYITALTKSNIFVMTNAYLWHHDVTPNRSNVIPALLPCPARIMFNLTDLCDVDKCKQLFLYDKMNKS